MTPPSSTPSPATRNMEDRDCDVRPRTAKSHHRLPKAGTFNNQRLPRSNSATGGLPRRRSFQGKPLTPAAQAAQDGYYQRKAAKMYAEKRKALAVAGTTTKENPTVEDAPKPAGVINITVDHLGVKIDDGNPGTPVKGGMGSRRNSRSRMSRSSSRRGSVRVEDKENAERPTPAQIDAFFAKKRGENNETPNENTSWDGSMPQRQNSKSFIQRHSRPLDTKNSNTGPIKDIATSNPVEKDKLTDQFDEHRQRRKRASKKAASQKRSGSGDQVQTSKTDVSTPAKAPTKQIEQSAKEEVRVLSVSDISEAEAHSISSSPLQAPENTPHTTLKDNESQSSGASSYKSSLSKAVSCTSEASGSTDAGKWCDECAGVGLHIAALLSDLKKHRSLSEAGAETTTPSKKGWKSTLLGSSESKSKSQNEKSRMQHENTVLRATVEFLYKKIENLEASGMVLNGQ